MSSARPPSSAAMSYPPKAVEAASAPSFAESLVATITLLFNTPLVPPPTPTAPEVQLTDLPRSSLSRQEERCRSTSTLDSRFTIESTPSRQQSLAQDPSSIPHEFEDEINMTPSHLSPATDHHLPARRVELAHMDSIARDIKGLGVLDAVTIE